MGFRTWSARRRRSAGGGPESAAVPGAAADMDLLFTQARRLRELAGDPEQAGDADRVYDFGIRWGAFLHGRLPRLVRYDRQGVLGPAERDRFADLCAELRAAAPLAERLGLAVPRLDGEPRRRAAPAPGRGVRGPGRPPGAR
ncbi:hypothetical protein ABZ892_00160 [Streptomyces sp. NPDC046924]|uniref:hypothetical protein n=1 Tax=Streptomyces sp. NPDC046924 TaxID=3155136 RepID=UPI0033E5B94C